MNKRRFFWIVSSIFLIGGGIIFQINQIISIIFLLLGIYFGYIATRPTIHFGKEPPKKSFEGDLWVQIKQ
jgi:hypothetical protein